ncbi:MAG: PQQ-binding-like beta-propeller repeat protein [Ilumatobacteraceae bacterium]
MHDAMHSGTSLATGPRSGDVRWHRDLGGNVTPGAVIGADGSVLIATNAGVLWALDPANGSTRWTYDGGSGFGNDLSTSAAVLDDGTIVWPGPGGTLTGLSRSGVEEWQLDLGGFVLSPAVSPSGRIYAVTMSGDVNAIDIADGVGMVAWTLATGGTTYGSPSIGPDATVFTTGSQSVVAVADEGARGTVVWTFAIDALIEVSPTVTAVGTVAIGTNDGFQYGLHSSDGSVAWKIERNADSYSSPVASSNGAVYYGDHSATLYAVDGETGRVLRTTTTKAMVGGRSWGIWTAPVIDATGAAYYGTRSGHVFGVGADGAVLFDLDVGGTVDSYPALDADGTLYIGTSTGEFFAIGGH